MSASYYRGCRSSARQCTNEAEHFVRTIGISEGSIVGEKPPIPSDIGTPDGSWFYQTARIVKVPPGMLPPKPDCFGHFPNVSAACAEGQKAPPVTARINIGVGGYQPLPYLLPGLVVKLGGSSVDQLYLARYAGLLLALIMLVIATLSLRSRDSRALGMAGLLLAVTPMVLYLSSSLTGSGLEITASIAFLCCLLRLTRSQQPESKWIWVGLGFSGAALALSRSTGPLWVFFGLFIALLMRDPRRSWKVARTAGKPALIAGLSILIALVLNRIWEGSYGIQHLPIGFENKREALTNGMQVLRDLTPQFIGKFGYLEFTPPLLSVNVWLIAVTALVIGAFIVSNWRGRLAVLASLLGATLVPLFFYIAIFRHTGKFGIQGRHMLPIVVALPLVAGELAYRWRKRVPDTVKQVLVITVPLLVSVVQLLAWYTFAHRYANGLDGPLNFLADAEWSPPLGWSVWAVIACVACLSLWLIPAVEARRNVASN